MSSFKSYELPKPRTPYIIGQEVISHGKYRGLATVTYIDPRDNAQVHRETDFIFLVDRPRNEPVGTIMPNYYKDADGRWCAVLVRQFRPQYEGDTIEFPAGFISRRKRETAEEAAIRETEEETTKTGRIVATSPPLTSEPVQIAAQLKGVLLETRDKTGEEANKQRLDKGEFIEEWIIPMTELEERLDGFAKEGATIDPSVWAFAIGIRCGRTLEI